MQKLTEKGLLAVLELLEEEFGVRVSDRKFDMYLQLLGDITDEQLQKGVIKLLQNRKYDQHKFPKVSEIREFIFGDKKELIDNKAEVAKGLLYEAIKRAGSYKSVTFDDPVIHAIIKQRLGGWITLCNMGQEEFQNFMKFEFSKAYNGYAQQGIGLVDKVLLGRSDRANEGKYEAQNVKLFGNPEKISQWHYKLDEIERKTGISKIGNQKVLL